METGKKLNSIICGFILAFSVISGAQANPGGATVVHGTVSFSQPNAQTLNITNTPGAIVNWQQFGIKQGEITRFIQQNSNSAILNRVVGQDPSAILGQLSSNGKVYLVNPNGVVFGQNAVVNTAGLIASTLNISNQDFINGLNSGSMRFSDLKNAAEILNQGFISASNGGEVVFVAPKITNEGTIVVDNGNIVLAAGQSVTINSLNYDNIEFEVQAPENKVLNIGKMISDGGSIGVFAGNIVNKGTVSANAVTVDDAGNIVFVAQNDTVIEDGTVTATSQTGKGGNIKILGERVGLFGQATVDASGASGGGEVLLGGDYQGRGNTKTATTTQVSAAAKIRADAKQSGDGGKIIVWADDFTLFYGNASARGGLVLGNGGFVEISGKKNLAFNGFVDVSAVNGTLGTIFFDPDSITIQTAAGANDPDLNPAAPNITFVQGGAVPYVISVAALTALSGDIVLQAEVDITLLGGVALNFSQVGGQSITFQAGNNIVIDGDITTAGASVILKAADPLATAATATGSVFVNGTITTNNGSVLLESSALSGTVTVSNNIDTGTGILDVVSQNDVVFNGGTISTTTISASNNANILIDGPVVFDSVTLDANVYINDGVTLTANTSLGIVSGRTLFINSSGSTTSLLSGTTSFTLSGPGIVDMSSNVNNLIDIFASTSTFTIAADMVISGQGTVGSASGATTLINNGSIISNAGSMTISADNWTNNGIIQADAASLSLQAGVGSWTNSATGTIRVDNAGVLSVANGNAWSNLGSFQLNTGSTLNLGGIFSGADALSIVSDGNVANIFNLNAGNMDLGGGVFEPTVSTGPVNIAGITISNGTLADANSVGLVMTSDSIFDGLTLDLDLAINNGLTLTANNSLSIATGRTLFLTSSGSTTSLLSGTASFTLSGPGIVDMSSNANNLIGIFASTSTFTIAADMVISGQGTVGSASGATTLINNGSIISNAGSMTINADNYTNNGQLTATNNSTLTLLNAALVNDGTITVDAGSTVTTVDNDLTNNATGIVEGSGNINVGTGTFINNGTVKPGGTGVTGILTVSGNYTQGATGALEIELNGTTPGTLHDQLLVSGATVVATLNGTLNLTLLGGYSPLQNDNYRFVEVTGGGSLSGTFAPENIPPEFGTNKVNYTATFADITIPAIFFDNSVGDYDLSNPLNWSTNTLPTSVDNILLDFNGQTLFLASGLLSINTLDLTLGTILDLTGGTLEIASASILAGNVNLSAGSFIGTGDITINGAFNWSGGSLSGSGLLTTSATTTLSNAAGTILARSWNNAGTVNWTAGDLTIDTGRTFSNTGSINADAAATLTVVATAALDNQSSFNINSNTLITGGGSFTNSGTLTPALASILTLDITGADSGSWAGAGDFTISSGSITLNSGFTISATGNLNIKGGTLDFNTGALVTVSTLTAVNLSAGTLTGSDDLTLSNAFSWTGGSLNGSGLLTTDGTSTLNNASGLTLDRNWSNGASGTVNWGQGTFTLNGITFTNNGNFNASAANTLGQSAAATFDNYASFNVNANTLLGTSLTFNNTGSVLIDPAAASVVTLTVNSVGSHTGNWDTGAGGDTLSFTGAGVNDFNGLSSVTGNGSFDLQAGTVNFNTGSAFASTMSVNISGGTLSFNDSTDVTLQSLALNTGTLNGTGNIIVAGAFDWISGSLGGSGLLTTNGISTLNNASGQTLDRNWSNGASGTVNWEQGAFTLNGITFTNNGNFNANATDTLTVAASAALDNQSSFNINSNTLITGGGSFTNSGTLTPALASTLTLDITGADSGSWAGAGDFTISGGSITLNSGFTISATGNLNISGGTLDFNTGFPATVSTLTAVNLSAGTLTGSDDLTLGNAFNWTGGSLRGSGLLTTNSISTLNNASGLTLDRDWSNGATGTINWEVGELILNGVTFTNIGSFNANAADTLTSFSASAALDNQGSFNIKSNTLITGGGSFTNSGILTTDVGSTLTMATATGADSGTWAGAGNYTINSGSRILNTGFNYTGIGNLNILGGTLDFSTGNAIVISTVFNLSAGELTGSDDLTLSNSFNWSGGNITGTGLLTTSAATIISGLYVKNIDRNWNNTGTVEWDAGDFAINAIFTNNSTFNANITSANSITGTGSFVNTGTFNDNAIALTSIAVSLDNSGTLYANSKANTLIAGSLTNTGTINILLDATFQLDSDGIHNFNTGSNINGSGSFEVTSGDSLLINTTGTILIGTALTNSGTVDLQSGTLDATSGYTQTAGSTLLSGGDLKVTTLNLNGGTLAGSAGSRTITGNVINNGGTVQPGGAGSIGTLIITGDYTNAVGGTVQIEIDSDTGAAGTAYDLLAIGGNATFAGTLELLATVNYRVKNNDSFTPITYATSGGTFLSILPIGGETPTPTYNSTNLFLLLLKDEVVFIGGSGSNWETAGNWSTNAIPLEGDNVNLGTFQVNLASNIKIGELVIGSGGLLTLGSSGFLTIGSKSVVDGAFTISGGTLDVASNSSFQNLTIIAGALQGDGNIVINGNLNWIGGSIVGTGLMTTNATTSVTGSTISRNWNNNGTMTWTSGNLSIASGITFTNSATGNFNANAANTLSINALSTFDNQGSLNINNDTLITGGVFNSSGTISVTSGNTLSIATTVGTDTGTWAGAGDFEISGGTRTLNSGFNISNTGNLNISGGTLDFSTGAAFTISTAVLNLSGGELTGSDDLTIANAFNWSGGSLTGAGLLTTSATTTISTVAKNIDRNWDNTGIVDWTAGNLTLISSKSFTNNGTFNADAAAILSIGSASSFDNQGNFNVNTDTTISGAGSFLQNSGQLVLSGSTLTIPTLTIAGGTLTGNGTIAGNVINNGGIIRPGDAGILGTVTINGDFTQNTGSIEIKIITASSDPATGDYDRLAISGKADFIGGSIDLFSVGYNKKRDDQYEPITYGSLGAGTTTVNPIGNESLAVNFNATVLNIEITSIGIISWTGLGDGVSWNDSANWSDNLIPTINDDVSIGIANSGSFDITITGDANAGRFVLGSTSSLTLASGTFTIAGAATLDGAFIVSGGTFVSQDTTVLNTEFNWNGGIISGGGKLVTKGITTLGAVTYNLNDITWDNFGTVNWNSGNIILSTSVINNIEDINNVEASAWNIQTEDALEISGTGSFNILAGSTLNVVSGTTTINTVFSNNGTANINGGALILAEAGNPADAGTYNITSGTLQLDSDRQFTGQLNMDGGMLRINASNSFANGVTVKGGTLEVASTGLLDVSSLVTGLVIETAATAIVNGEVTGNIDNSGILTGSGIVVGDVTNAGNLNPGNEVGVFTIDGNLTLLETSNLNIDIAGLEKGVSYDELIVKGDVIFNGNLNINIDTTSGYNMNLQDSFYPVSYASRSGDVVLTATPGYDFDLTYNATDLNLVTTVVPGLFSIDPQNDVVILMNIITNLENIEDINEVAEELVNSEKYKIVNALICT